MEWWRLTRTPYGRAVYDAMEAVGLHVASMDEYVRSGALTTTERHEPPAGVRIDDHGGDRPFTATVPEVAALDGPHDVLTDADADAGDRLLVARDGTQPVGYALVSDRPVAVAPLGRTLRYEGAYVWRVYVRPADRQRGIATALIARAVAVARRAFDPERQIALIASDNRPSQWAFEAVGFVRHRRHRRLGVDGVDRYWTVEA